MSLITGFDPSLPAPSIEKYFEFYTAEERADFDAGGGDWSPYPMQKPEQPALLAKTLSSLCLLCRLYHEISIWNKTRPEDAALGSQQDVAFRVHMSRELATWNTQLHPNLRPSLHAMAHAYYIE